MMRRTIVMLAAISFPASCDVRNVVCQLQQNKQTAHVSTLQVQPLQRNVTRATRDQAVQANATALEQFKGTEVGTLVVNEGPLIHFMSFGAEADLATKNTVAFRTTLIGSPDQPLFDFILKYDQAKKGFLFSVRTYYLNSNREYGPGVKDLPVSFVESSGFSGKGTATFKGQELQVTVAIKQKKTQDDEWEVTFASGDAMVFQYKFESKKAAA
ncbi:MAG: hypothetical protein ABR555_05205 [Pyrinomonadaceae bacterium]